MQIEAAAAGVGVHEFWEYTYYEVSIAVRGLGRRLKYLNLFLANNVGPLLSAWAKGNPGREMVRAAQRALDEY